MDVPLRMLVVFPAHLWSDSLFSQHRPTWLALTICAFVMVLAHPVRPNRLTACITVLGSIGWYLLASVTFVMLFSASV
jgi:hypothetical protein